MEPMERPFKEWMTDGVKNRAAGDG